MAGWGAETADQKDRLFLWIPVAFGAGIAAYFGVASEPPPLIGAIMAGVLIPFVVRGWKRQHDSRAALFTFLAIAALFCAACGFTAAQVGTSFHGTNIVSPAAGPQTVAGFVQSIEDMGEARGSRVMLLDPVIEGVAAQDTPRKVRVTFRKDEGIEAGQMISALVKLDPPSQAVAPGAYDFRRHLFFEGIGGVGFAFSGASVIEPAKAGGASLMFERIRQAINEAIKARAGPVAAGIMTALITGERGAIAEDDNQAMRDSGIYHLLSISGAHVCMVAGVLFFFSRALLAFFPWVALRWPLKKIAAMVAITGAAFYVALAGAEVPAVRALMMTGLVMIAIMIDRSPLSLRLVAFAACMVLLVWPHSLTGVSFHMSFSAVAGLICFYDYIRIWWTRWYSRAGFLRKSMLYMIGVVMTSVVAGTITGFFSLYHFQQFPVYGVIGNMLAVPITGVIIMPAAIVAMILLPFGLSGWAIDAMEWGVVWMLGMAHWCAGLEGAVIRVQQWPAATFWFFVCGLILFLLWRGWRGKGVGAAFMAAGLMIAPFGAQPDIMVSGNGKLVALRGVDDTLYFSTRQAERFSIENWQRMNGHEGQRAKRFEDDGSPASCDEAGCRAVVAGAHVAVLKSRAAYFEDRDWADIMIADFPLPRERKDSGKTVIGLYELRRGGAASVYLREGDVQMRSIASDVGQRPWAGPVPKQGRSAGSVETPAKE